ncbi:hypothetical protein [Agriterribacter sp.]|uniref:hypothetical protein n=1 Tax=Agriterribacter sp. TaxID=2821509 RepID=UPI002CB798C1|nr:hypothetical protein [Agriterribacter sp.]HTN05828.1 hypothetical protein [Agriterribacter sp.]
MILKDDFYTITQLTEENNTIQATLKLNPEHPIFEGHFPGQPVVPGVCMVQMIKELLETVTGKTMLLQQSDHIKFLSVIDPRNVLQITIRIMYQNNNGGVNVTGTILREDIICLKLKGHFTIL